MILAALLAFYLHPACAAVASMKMGGEAAAYYRGSYEKRVATCQVVVSAAVESQLDPVLAAVLSWEESSWDGAQVHPRTQVAGPLQVAPRWWCPGKTADRCDLVRAGVRAVAYYLREHKQGRTSQVLGLCHYNAGNVCYPGALRRARYIDAEIREVRRQVSAGRRVPTT